MSGRGGGGRGRGWYYKMKYGGGGRKRENENDGDEFERPAPARGGADRQADAGDADAMKEEITATSAAGAPQAQYTSAQLRDFLLSIDGKSYPFYKDIIASYGFPQGYTLHVVAVQSDPFAPPSRVRVTVPASVAGYPPEAYSSGPRRVALGDYITRRFHQLLQQGRHDQAARGGGWHGSKGGDMQIDAPGQHVLQRTSCAVSAAGDVDLRFTIALPAQGRSILGRRAAAALTEALPALVAEAVPHARQDAAAVLRHVVSVEDQEELRASLPAHGLVAFVRDGSVLPRRSGVDDRPMEAAAAVPFRSPPELKRTMRLKSGATITGMGIPEGITLIVGGGFHGKSTLLEALQVGVYNHVPGDGREFVVCDASAVKIRAEDGRRVEGVDISAFINNLPQGRGTREFRSEDASGSTSQAAAILEALEAGARVLLIDEDTSATNFMIRDARMQALVAPRDEPITPFLHKVRAMRRERGASTILVVGGSGDYFEVADTVIAMHDYAPRDATADARRIVAETGGGPAGPGPSPTCLSGGWRSEPQRLTGAQVKVTDIDCISFGFGPEAALELGALEQLVEQSQTRAIADAILHLRESVLPAAPGCTVRAALDALEAAMEGARGLDALSRAPHPGALARPRRAELAAALNRLRSLRASQRPAPSPATAPAETPAPPRPTAPAPPAPPPPAGSASHDRVDMFEFAYAVIR
eukprot:tig00020927_g15975.t1